MVRRTRCGTKNVSLHFFIFSTVSADFHQPLGQSGLRVPRVLFGTAALGNVHRVITEQAKLEIVGEWFRHVQPPVFVEAKYSDGDGAALEMLGRVLQRLEIAGDEIIVQLAANRAVQECWDKSCRLLGDVYRPNLIVAAAGDEEGWQVARSLRDSGRILAAGIRISGQEVATATEHVPYDEVDYIQLVGGCTVMRHSPEVISLLQDLDRRIPVVLSGMFDGGFLVGGNRLDGRVLNSEDSADRSILAWRKSFVALCDGHGISPAHACIQFALSLPGVIAVRLDSTYADRVAENVRSAYTPVPVNFWGSMKEEGLLSRDYPLLG